MDLEKYLSIILSSILDNLFPNDPVIQFSITKYEPIHEDRVSWGDEFAIYVWNDYHHAYYYIRSGGIVSSDSNNYCFSTFNHLHISPKLRANNRSLLFYISMWLIDLISSTTWKGQQIQ